MKQITDNTTEGKDKINNNAMIEFEKEVAMLDKFRNDYIVHFFGAVFIPSKICMVTEYALYGSIQDLMKKYPVFTDLTLNLRTKLLLDAAKGIKYLHDNGILHRDIKPDNFLIVSLEENIPVNAKLTDFGATRNVNQMMTNMTFTKGIGTPAYMAPEILNREHYKKPADMFSFAVTMLEVVIWGDAYPKTLYTFAWNIADLVSCGKRTQTITYIEDDGIKQLIEDCWTQDPKERPMMDSVIQRLNKLWEDAN